MKPVGINMKPLTKTQATEWINALRSGKYEQTKKMLQDENGFCCLGVFCAITKNTNKKITSEGYLGGIVLHDQYLSFSNLYGSFLIDKNYVPGLY